MTPEDVAKRLVALYNEGKALQVEEELYADEVKSYEQDPSRNATGKAAVMAKTKVAFEMMAEVRHSEAAEYKVNNDTFLIRFEMDATAKNGMVMKGTEWGFYKVKDGKVVEEYFYF